MKDKKTPNLLKGRTKEWDYYDRPSKQSSANIAIVCMIGLMIMLFGMAVLETIKKVSDDRNDFDNTSIKKKLDSIGEIESKREFHKDGTNVRANVYFYEQTYITSP